MLEIRDLTSRDIAGIVDAFRQMGWDRPASRFERFLAEQTKGLRRVLVAFEDGEFAGYPTVLWKSKYPAFNSAGIPEIVDLNVLLKFRRKGIATRLIEGAEQLILSRSDTTGIGVGLDADYGNAQRLYVALGYRPDGRGIVWRGRYPQYGEQVTVDYTLILYFTKSLR